MELVEEPAALEPLRGEPYASEEPPEPQAECLPLGFVARPPSVASYAEPSGSTCRAIAESTRRLLGKHLRADWLYAYEDGRLDIDFGCDRLGAIEEITMQHGDGHAGTLALVRLRRGGDGLDWELLVLRYYESWSRLEPDDPAAGVWRGRVSAAAVERALEISRAALVLEAEEHASDERNYGTTSTSGDFHAFLRLVDEHGHARTVHYAGHPSSIAQLEWQIAVFAVWPLREVVAAAKVEPAQPDADSRRFFMERFVETMEIDYRKPGGSWVQGRLIEMAAVHASLDLIPALGMLLCPEWEDAPTGAYGHPALASMFGLLGRDEAIAVDERGWLMAEQVQYWIGACDIRCTAP